MGNSKRTRTHRRHVANPKEPVLVTATNGDEEVIARRHLDLGYVLGKEWLKTFENNYAAFEITVNPL